MRGTAKITRKDGVYHVYVRNHFWQRWQPLCINGEQIKFEDFSEFGKVTKINCFDEIIVKHWKFDINRLDL